MKKLIGLFLLISGVATATTQVLVVSGSGDFGAAATPSTDLTNANTVVTIVTTGVPAVISAANDAINIVFNFIALKIIADFD